MKSDVISTLAPARDNSVQSYYLKLGKETIHGLSREDIESLHEAIDDFLDREDEISLASEDLSSDLGQYSMIRKTTTFDDGIFNTDYSASGLWVEIQCTPSWVILDLFMSLLSFLNQVEKMDIQCSIPGIKPRKIKPLPLKKSRPSPRTLPLTSPPRSAPSQQAVSTWSSSPSMRLRLPRS